MKTMVAEMLQKQRFFIKSFKFMLYKVLLPLYT